MLPQRMFLASANPANRQPAVPAEPPEPPAPSYPIYLSYGYFGGGVNFPSFYSTVDRIDYSNDTATASVRGPLSLARGYLAATQNSPL